jgi:hypothetical protein
LQQPAADKTEPLCGFKNTQKQQFEELWRKRKPGAAAAAAAAAAASKADQWRGGRWPEKKRPANRVSRKNVIASKASGKMRYSPSRCFLCLSTFALLLCAAQSSCPGSPTNLPISDATSMSLIMNVSQGSMFLAGPADNQLRVVHVWGTAYEMGYAQGLLLRDVLHLVLAPLTFSQDFSLHTRFS